jgi:hypothetical protein
MIAPGEHSLNLKHKNKQKINNKHTVSGARFERWRGFRISVGKIDFSELRAGPPNAQNTSGAPVQENLYCKKLLHSDF